MRVLKSYLYSASLTKIFLFFSGEEDRLSVFVKQDTTQVKCFAPSGLAPRESACEMPLNTMPVSASMEQFGARGTEGVDVGLPLRYSSRE